MTGENRESFSILLVDRESESLPLVQKSIQDCASFSANVDFAKDFETVLKKLSERSYHLLLLDSELQNDKEFQLIREIRSSHSQMPFVLMTSIRDNETVRRAKEFGIADLIIKSESHFNDLAEKLKQVCSRFSAADFHKSQQHFEFMNVIAANSLDQQSLVEPSIKDDLTGLYSHSYLYDRVVREFAQAARHNYPIACLMIDLDHFRAVNEKFGHRLGDGLLKKAADLLFEHCRLNDLVARYGGEEFAVLMPHTDYAGAFEVANRLQLIFAEHRFVAEAGAFSEEANLTVSIGISAYPEDKMEKRGELLSFASQALIRSKAAGRNRVTQFKDILPTVGDGMPALRISEDKIMDFQRRMTEVSMHARRGTIDASKALIAALESKDKFTAGHASNCAKYSIQVAEAIGMSLDEAEVVEHAALLHDIGKICMPDSVVLKDGKLSFSEFEAMRQHPYLGYKILKPIKFLQQEAVYVLHHHEWWNGEGYPCKLKGEDIPIGARIISVIDAYDAMRIAGSRYKLPMSAADAIAELINCAGTQFDPKIVKALVDVLISRKELAAIDYDKAKLEAVINTASVK